MILRLLIWVGLLWLGATITAKAGEAFFLKDYPTVILPPKGGLELYLEYLTMNSTVDVAGVRQRELSSIDSRYADEALGNAMGLRMQANYGFTDKTGIHGDLAWRKIDTFLGELKTLTAESSVRRMVLRSDRLMVTCDVGIRGNVARDVSVTDLETMGVLVSRLTGKEYGIRDDGDYVWFDSKIPNGAVSFGIASEGLPAPTVKISDMWDATPFARSSLGMRFKGLVPGIFLEGGTTFVGTKADSTLRYYLPEQEHLLPRDLSRRENFARGGSILIFKFQHFQSLLEYSYLRLFRGGTAGINDNHILKGDVAYSLTERLAFDVGGIYYHRQLNGVLPFLYNGYTRTAFDHPYGIVNAGFIVSFY